MLPLILAVADDDDRYFVEKIYVQYEKQLYVTSMKYLQNHFDAEDNVHNTIELVIESADKFRAAHEKGYIEKLLMIACRNCAFNALRLKKRRNEHEQSLVRFNYDGEEYEKIDIPDYNSNVDKVYVSEENCRYLHDLINKLDDKYRDLILLKSMGFDNKYISKAMNISEELVRQRYVRAKKQLLKMGGKDLYAK